MKGKVWVLGQTGLGLKPGPTTFELTLGKLCPFLGFSCGKAAPHGYQGWVLSTVSTWKGLVS